MVQTGRSDKRFTYIVIALAGAVVFVVPPSWIVQRAWPRWLAATIGIAGFPVLPAVWHFLGERRRRRAETTGTLTASDRLLLRVIAVGVLFVAPLATFDRARTWAGINNHYDWFAQWGTRHLDHQPPRLSAGDLGPFTSDDRVLEYAPADAEALIWVRSAEHLQVAMSGKASKSPDDAVELLYAARKGDYMVASRVVPAKVDIDKLRREMKEQIDETPPDAKHAPRKLELHHPRPHFLVGSTSSWNEHVTRRLAGHPGPAPLIKLLGNMPKDAFVIAAALPKTQLFLTPVQRATGWVAARGDKVHIEVDALVIGRADALENELRVRLHRAVADTDKDCRSAAKHLTDAVKFTATGTSLHLKADIEPAKVLSLMFCAAFSSK